MIVSPARHATLGAILVVSVACEGAAGPAPVQELVVQQDSIVMGLGDTVRVAAEAFGPGGQPLPAASIRWSSNDPRVARITETGHVTAVGSGTTTVTAEARGRVRQVGVTVSVVLEELSAGLWHTCGLTATGRVACWGSNDWGELGDASLTGSDTPVLVRGDRRFLAVSAGGTHTCGVTGGDSAAYCWGANWSGQLGIGTADFGLHLTAERIPGALAFTDVRAGDRHVCGVAAGNAVHCWGGGLSGQLGSTALTADCPGIGEPCGSSPTALEGSLPLDRVTAGVEHSCGLTGGGAAYCWGSNATGQLGDGTLVDRMTPVAVLGGHLFVSITAGAEHTCALTSAGMAFCWGDDTWGQLGTDTDGNTTEPAPVAGDHRFASLSAGRGHTCGVLDDGTLRCWGLNGYGQLGNGTRVTATVPTVAGDARMRWRSVAGGGYHTCGVSEAGVAYCWGLNLDGQLGIGPRMGSVRSTPVVVAGQRLSD